MNVTKKIGIWMDYTSAHVMSFSEQPKEIAVIESTFESKLKSKEKEKGEKHLHSLARQCKTDYFKKIASIILQYDKVLLFGPTNAKAELFNLLSEDHHFFKIKTYLKETGKMTLKQRNKVIHEHFASPMYK
ncbi:MULTISPECIES: hypothetical protein [unclassified Flavobacterium]|uniref:hypothetical protein n=1 Tax=unclassified Flavobacterium TaxID=196869 RepID=UPI000EB27ED1|nr:MULTISPECIES: hypothetical protein [unclassified Flavobacterium]RKS03609.1 hypothetical protein C8C84_3370 [Flavobacterium sp. 102]